MGKKRMYMKLVAETMAKAQALTAKNIKDAERDIVGGARATDMMSQLKVFAQSAIQIAGWSPSTPGTSSKVLSKLKVAKKVDLSSPPEIGDGSPDDLIRILRDYNGLPATMRNEALRRLSNVEMRDNNIGQKVKQYQG